MSDNTVQTFDQVYYGALSGLTYQTAAVPVYQNTAPDQASDGSTLDTYVIFNEAEADYILDRSNVSGRTRHLVQVHVVSIHPEAVRSIMQAARTALKAVGVKPRYCAAMMYEEDTGYWHLPMYTWYVDKDT